MVTEATVWSGCPSQIKNLGWFLFCGIFFFFSALFMFFLKLWLWGFLYFLMVLFMVPLFLIMLAYTLWVWLDTKHTRYELTTERLVVSTGILSKTTDQLELYRVRDYRLESDYILRSYGLSNIVLISTDKTSKITVVEAIDNGAEILAVIRNSVEELRKHKRRII